jgi:hypothetical protein
MIVAKVSTPAPVLGALQVTAVVVRVHQVIASSAVLLHVLSGAR